MPRYRLKPKEVEAIQWDGTTDGLDLLSVGTGATIQVAGRTEVVWVRVGHYWETLKKGDWLILDGKKAKRMDDDDFTELYELVPPHGPETWPI